MSEEKSNRPKDNALFQQRLKAWTPMLTLRDASIFFLVTGVIVIALGLLIFFTDNQVVQFSVDYTDCQNGTNKTTCNMTLVINANISGPVFFYYGLTNYYQNHRQLINSMDTTQLTGSSQTPASSCLPLLNDSAGNFYAPCGQMPNVIFNDTFVMYASGSIVPVPWTKTNISMNSDRLRYGTPASWSGTIKPPNWAQTAKARSNTSYVGDEELLVWLRPSPLPTLRKLYRILRPSTYPVPYNNGLPADNYTVVVTYNYPVLSFGGHKMFIVSNVSWLGGKNPALGILYLVTGCIEIIIGLIIVVVWMKSRGQIEKLNRGAR